MIPRIFSRSKYAKLRLGVALNLLGIFLMMLLPNQALALYNPSYIMPDGVFVNSGTMSEGDIESFLYNMGSYYSLGRTGFRVPPAGNRQIWDGGGVYYEGTMVGPIGQEVDSTNWSAAHLIYMVSQWYGINPQVILVTIQKESSMITSSYPSYWGLVQWTTGYAYTESGIVGACGTATNGNPTGSCAGFAMQVDWGGGGLKYFYNCSISRTCSGQYYAGNTLYLDGTAIYVGNHSTAALYRYTPHNTYGGNFRTNFTNWFGSIDSDSSSPVYRFYNMRNGTHFYTASEAERNNVIARWSSIYRYEGIAYILNTNNTHPLYRFYNMRNGTHFYTPSEPEANMVINRWSNIYRFEGITYYVSSWGTPVYRFYNVQNGTHFYTASEPEAINVINRWSNIYRFEGVGFYITP